MSWKDPGLKAACLIGRKDEERRALITDFDEEEVAEWFVQFEKVEYEWPENKWVSLVANKLMGKALAAYDKMPMGEPIDYEEFKASILWVYELCLEAYHLKFIDGKRRARDSYLDSAYHLEEVFAKWLVSERVVTFNNLKELMVLEQLVNIADRDVVPLLWEKRFKTVKEAAVWANDCTLAYKGVSFAGNSLYI